MSGPVPAGLARVGRQAAFFPGRPIERQPRTLYTMMLFTKRLILKADEKTGAIT